MRLVTRRVRLLVALAVLLLFAAYLAYDWSQYCVGGPVKRLVMSVINGGSYTVRCAG